MKYVLTMDPPFAPPGSEAIRRLDLGPDRQWALVGTYDTLAEIGPDWGTGRSAGRLAAPGVVVGLGPGEYERLSGATPVRRVSPLTSYGLRLQELRRQELERTEPYVAALVAGEITAEEFLRKAHELRDELRMKR